VGADFHIETPAAHLFCRGGRSGPAKSRRPLSPHCGNKRRQKPQSEAANSEFALNYFATTLRPLNF
jgi:hypothetical protein